MTSPLSEVHRNKTMTRSKIASKILSETSPETREKVKKYGDKVMSRKAEIEAIQLTDEEIRRAILNAKIQKWNEERTAEYWKELESRKPKDQ